MTRITLLYDNEVLAAGLHGGWGFSCLLERGDTRLLFDTGWDGDRVLENARQLGIDLRGVDTIFISHGHWDHIGGLARVLGAMTRPRVVVPASLSGRLKQEVGGMSELVEVAAPRALGPGLRSTGEVAAEDPAMALKEQALLCDLDAGVALVTGCAHPGLSPLLDLAGRRGRVSAVVGGFHGFDALDALEPVDRVLPCHCTRRKAEILARFPGKARRCGVGLVVDLA
jgi:7,8-dihydropterin-6-yl-methyl-4-(beta-D-ribofuranosyl)aminobenzene 5'-phosphate synthase